MPRISSWTTLSAPELWKRWHEQFDSEEEAIAMAIWIGNRLVKDKAKSTRRKFYSLKDTWLSRNQDSLISGRIARKETATCYDCDATGEAEEDECPVCDGTGEHRTGGTCWTCDGTGEINTGGRCDRCGGSGIYKSWFLYEHQLLVAQQRYSFHSYLEPQSLSETPGADCESYGGRFTDQELKELALPMSGILKVLGYVAITHWDMQFSKHVGKFVEKWTVTVT